MSSFLESVKKYRTKHGLSGGKAPKKGSEEYDAVMAMMGKHTASHTKFMKSEAAVHKKAEAGEKKHQREMAAAHKKALMEEIAHKKAMIAEEKKPIAELKKKAKKGDLTLQQIRAYASLL